MPSIVRGKNRLTMEALRTARQCTMDGINVTAVDGARRGHTVVLEGFEAALAVWPDPKG